MVSYIINQATIQFSLRKQNLLNQDNLNSEMQLRLTEAVGNAFCIDPLAPKPKDVLND